MLLDYQK